MTSDPDRTVRHLAAVRLFCRARDGAEIPMPVAGIKDREVRYLFVEGMPKLCVHPNLVGSFESLLTGPRARNRQLALRLLVHLRPALDDYTGAAMDALIRSAMRNKEREVRRDATAVARVASTDYTQAELAGRLREQLRRHPPPLIPIFIVVQVALFIATTFFLPKEYGFAPHLLSLVFCIYVFIRDRAGEHGITHDECLETLCAMEPLAETAPEKLRDSVPELRKLSGRSELNSEVRAKARELLAKVHDASPRAFPIAADPPRSDPASLPVPSSASTD